MNETDFLKQAIEKARDSVTQGGFPAGAVVVKDGEVIGEGLSIGNKLHDPTSHGEVAAIRNACNKLSTSKLADSVLYASLQPCAMCLSAAMWAGISKIVFACSKDRVSPQHYGSHYQPDDLNKTFLKPVELVHVPELEQESLQIVTDWEALQTTH